MTYKMNPALRKVKSPVVLVFPDGSNKSYRLGEDVVEDSFEKAYQIDTIKADGDTIQIILKEREILEIQNWNGEEAVSFF